MYHGVRLAKLLNFFVIECKSGEKNPYVNFLSLKYLVDSSFMITFEQNLAGSV